MLVCQQSEGTIYEVVPFFSVITPRLLVAILQNLFIKSKKVRKCLVRGGGCSIIRDISTEKMKSLYGFVGEWCLIARGNGYGR